MARKKKSIDYKFLKDFFIGPSEDSWGGTDAGEGFTVLEQIYFEQMQNPCFERMCLIPIDNPEDAYCEEGEHDRVGLPTDIEIEEAIGRQDAILLHTHPISIDSKRISCPSVGDMASIAVLQEASPNIKASCLMANFFIGDKLRTKLSCWSHDDVARGLADIARQTLIDKPFAVSTRGSKAIEKEHKEFCLLAAENKYKIQVAEDNEDMEWLVRDGD